MTTETAPTPPPTTPETPPAGLGTPPPVEPPKAPEPPKQEEAAKPDDAAKPEAPAPLAVTDIKLPEGVTVPEKVLGDFVSLMNDPALSPAERAQKLIDLQVAATRKASEQGEKAFVDLQAEWVNACKSDKDFGGANFDANVALISSALDTYGDAAARQAFDATGAGNNPAIFRFIAKMAKDVMKEGQPISGAPSSAGSDLAAKLYTHKNS